MKLIFKQQSLIVWCGIPLAIGFFLLIFFFPYAIAKCLRLHWLILILSVILALSPWGKIRLTATSKVQQQYTVWVWLRKIISLQIGLQLLFILQLYFITKILPVTALITPHVSNSLLYLHIAEGLFPWAFFALLAINFGLQAYNQRRDAYFHTTLNQLWPASGNSPLGIVANSVSRGATVIAISGNLAFLSLWCVYLISKFTWPISYGFNAATLVLVFSILIICLLKKTQIWLKQLLNPKSSFTTNLLRIFCIFTALILVLNAIVHGWQHLPIKPPTFLTHLQSYNPNVWWVLFINVWWLLWLPFISIIIASISEGYQVRHIILATLLWPLLSTIILSLFQQHISLHFNLPVDVAWILAMLVAGFVSHQISNNKYLPMLILCYLPTTIPKPRPQLKLLSKMPLIMSIILYAFLPAGMLTLTLLYTLCVFLLTLLACAALLSCCIQCYRLRQKKTCKL